MYLRLEANSAQIPANCSFGHMDKDHPHPLNRIKFDNLQMANNHLFDSSKKLGLFSKISQYNVCIDKSK